MQKKNTSSCCFPGGKYDCTTKEVKNVTAQLSPPSPANPTAPIPNTQTTIAAGTLQWVYYVNTSKQTNTKLTANLLPPSPLNTTASNLNTQNTIAGPLPWFCVNSSKQINTPPPSAPTIHVLTSTSLFLGHPVITTPLHPHPPNYITIINPSSSSTTNNNRSAHALFLVLLLTLLLSHTKSINSMTKTYNIPKRGYILAVLISFYSLPTVNACSSCPGDSLIDTEQLQHLLPLLTVATLNCRSGLFSDQADRLFDLAKSMLDHSIHALVLTETRSPAHIHETHNLHRNLKDESLAFATLHKQHRITAISSSSPTQLGLVTILLHPILADKLPTPHQPFIAHQGGGRYLDVTLHFPHHHTLTIAAVYGVAGTATNSNPHKFDLQQRIIQRLDQLAALTHNPASSTGSTRQDEGRPAPRDHLVLLGDFNEVAHPFDTNNPNRPLDTQGLLAHLTSNTPMIDTLRLHHPDENFHTCATTSSPQQSQSPTDARARLDYIFISPSLLHNTEHVGAAIDDCRSWLAFPSQDHAAAITQFTHFLPTTPHPSPHPPHPTPPTRQARFHRNQRGHLDPVRAPCTVYTRSRNRTPDRRPTRASPIKPRPQK
jgi:exonuclease III